jgi:hypothetical protein
MFLRSNLSASVGLIELRECRHEQPGLLDKILLLIVKEPDVHVQHRKASKVRQSRIVSRDFL